MTSAESDSGAPSLFGLAPCGVCHARGITVAAVRSYRTFSPLPWRRYRGFLGRALLPASAHKSVRATQSPYNDAKAVCFLWRFPSSNGTPTSRKTGETWATPHPPGRYPAHCSAEFGLSSPPILVRAAGAMLLPEWAGRPSGPAAYGNIICEGETSDLRLQTSDLRLQTSDLRPRTSDLRPRTSDLRLQTSDLGPQTSDLRLRTSDFGPQTSDLGLQTSDFGPQTSDFGPQTSDFGPQTSDLRPQTSDLGLQTSGFLRLRTSNFRPQTSDLRLPQTSDLKLRTSDFRPRTSDFRPQTSDLGPQTSDLRLRTSDLRPRTSDLGLRDRRRWNLTSTNRVTPFLETIHSLLD